MWSLSFRPLVDLCAGHAHAAISRCRDDIKRHAKPLKRWAIGEAADRKTADHLRFHHLGPEWRKEDPYLCTYGFFYWGWALTCNKYLRRAWGLDPNAGNPWAEFGGLMSWLLGDARASIVSRVHKALGDKNIKCDVGLHLRRADNLPGDGTQTENLKWKVHLEEALAGLPSRAPLPPASVGVDPADLKEGDPWTMEELEDIRDECFAADVDIDFDKLSIMSRERVEQYFVDGS